MRLGRRFGSRIDDSTRKGKPPHGRVVVQFGQLHGSVYFLIFCAVVFILMSMTDYVWADSLTTSQPPKYMRFGILGPSFGWEDAKTGFRVWDLSDCDVDVSNDGRHWFHFAGERCLSHLPQYQRTASKKRNCSAWKSNHKIYSGRGFLPITSKMGESIRSWNEPVRELKTPPKTDHEPDSGCGGEVFIPSLLRAKESADAALMERWSASRRTSTNTPETSLRCGSGILWRANLFQLAPFGPISVVSMSSPIPSISRSSGNSIIENFWPLNGLSFSATLWRCPRDRVLHAMRRSMSFARFTTSAKCDSASAACFLADAISFLNKSASWRAPRARIRALDAIPSDFSANVSADLAFTSAESEVSEASFAISPACAACLPSDSIALLDKAFVCIKDTIPTPIPSIRMSSERLPKTRRFSLSSNSYIRQCIHQDILVRRLPRKHIRQTPTKKAIRKWI